MNKPKFDINKYQGKYCMHCNTEKKAEIFCNYLDSKYRTWRSGGDDLCEDNRYTSRTWWRDFKEDTIYYFNKGTFGRIRDVLDFAATHGSKDDEFSDYTILEFDIFDWDIKPKFNIDDYKGNYVMHCDTEKKAEIFLNYLDSIGRTWCSSAKYTDNTSWGIYEENTVYYFNTGELGDISSSEYTVLEFDDFTWSYAAQIQNNTITIPDIIFSQAKMNKDVPINISVTDGNIIISCRNDDNVKSSWVDFHATRFKTMESQGDVKYHILDESIIAYFSNREQFFTAKVSGDDVFDLDTGLAIIYAKYNKEILPDFILKKTIN